MIRIRIHPTHGNASATAAAASGQKMLSQYKFLERKMIHHNDALDQNFDALKMLCETAIKFDERQDEKDQKEENSPILGNIQSDPRELESTAEVAPVRPPIHGGDPIWSVEDQAKPIRKRKIICSQHELNGIISTHDPAVQTRLQRRNNLIRINEEGTKSNAPIFRAQRRGRGQRSTAGGGEQRVSRHGSHGRGRAPMKESSRCSRYNGRGWRCSRRTYVGYCLCEYHLEKARTKINTNSNGHVVKTRKFDINVNSETKLDYEKEEGEITPNENE